MNRSNEPEVCGLSKLWSFKGKFAAACVWHDREYDKQDAKLSDVDKAFLRMLLAASDGWVDRVKAYGMYAIAHVYGLIFWKGPR